MIFLEMPHNCHDSFKNVRMNCHDNFKDVKGNVMIVLKMSKEMS